MQYKNRDIKPSSSLIEALKKMDSLDKKLLIVMDQEKFIGLLSAGDIQRAIIKNTGLDVTIDNILRKNIRVGKESDSLETIKNMMLEFRMEFCPVVNGNNEVINIYFWEDVFSDKKRQVVNKFNLPVVIMAGGFGTRLRPLTNVLPKPLIPIGEKTMLEEIFDRFGKHGCDKYFISVNYKAELIEFYLNNLNLPHKINYFKEDKPMGTAGSLSLLKGKIDQTFFINNCDILIDQDYSEILSYHQENKNEITLVAALKSYSIPYGTIDSGINGELLTLKEKPELTFKINSGMYILEPHLLNEIPENKIFHITDLIEKVKSRTGKVGVFPVSEKSWTDVGSWEEIKKYYNNVVD
ncbi:MAG: NTP transferase domain-containing protein [Bacteroidetes bacterium]|nr:NTP transferase domain-containing protein [Bacteroidota bacterium]